MKTLIAALLAFSTLFIVGFTNQREKLSKPEAVEAAIFSRSKFAQYNSKYVLVYPDSQGKPKLIYDPDILMVYPVGQPDPISRIVAKVGKTKLNFDPNTPIQIIDLTSPVVASTAGSIVVGVSAKELLTNPSLRVALRDASKDRRIIIGVLAAISGYGLGVFAANHLYLPNLDSRETSKIVGDSALWYKNHLRIFVLALVNAEAELQSIPDDAIRTKALDALNAATKVVAERLSPATNQDKLPHLRSSDIEYIVKSLSPFQSEVSKATNITASWSQVIAGLLWLPLVALAAGIAVIAGMVGWDYYSDRRRSALPRIV